MTFEIARSANGYDAVGSGNQVALGAIHGMGWGTMGSAENMIEGALMAASQFSAHVREPFHLISCAPTMVVG